MAPQLPKEIPKELPKVPSGRAPDRTTLDRDSHVTNSIKGFNQFCESLGPKYTPTYSYVSENPFKVRVGLAGEIFESRDSFGSRLKAMRASATLAMQWLSKTLPKKSPTPASRSNWSGGKGQYTDNHASRRARQPRCPLIRRSTTAPSLQFSP